MYYSGNIQLNSKLETEEEKLKLTDRQSPFCLCPVVILPLYL